VTSRKHFKAANLLHLKYVDDMTLAESINLKDKLISVPESVRPLPDSYHARTGHALPVENSEVFRQLQETRNYATENKMKINYKKTKVMVFNTCKKWDFMPQLEIEGNQLELAEELKILGVVVRSDLKWSSNSKYIVEKGYNRLWMLRRLKNHGAGHEDLKDVYIKQVRSVLELAVPAWHPGLTLSDSLDIERVQKAALHIILGTGYNSYSSALKTAQLDSLADRREALCLKFSKKAAKHDKHSNWFKLNNKNRQTRQPKTKFCPVTARTRRFQDSPISYLTDLLNKYFMKKQSP
jgi:hypothetical protein